MSYTTKTLQQEFKDINPDIVNVHTTGTLTQAFSNAAPVKNDMAMDVKSAVEMNRGREMAAADGLKEIKQSVEVLDETIKKVEPDQPAAGGDNLLGRSAMVGVSLATGGAVTAVVAAMAGPGAAAVFVGLGSLATFKDVAGIARDAMNGGGEEDRKAKADIEADNVYKSNGPTVNTFDYVAQQQTNGPTFGAKNDIKAFKKNGMFDDLMGRAEISKQSLDGIKTLKCNLEDQMCIREQSLQNSKDVRNLLNVRSEKGVSVEQTQETQHMQGYKLPENEMNNHLSFNV